MKPVAFVGHNIVFAEDQPEYQSLPAYKSLSDPQGRALFCWHFTLRERLQLLLHGRVWHEVLTFNKPLQPQRLSVKKPT